MTSLWTHDSCNPLLSMGVIPISLLVLSMEPFNFNTCTHNRANRKAYQLGQQVITIAQCTIYRYGSVESRNSQSADTLRSTDSVDSTGRDIGITPVMSNGLFHGVHLPWKFWDQSRENRFRGLRPGKTQTCLRSQRS